MSTSVAYLRKRLKAIGRDDLLEGAERGEFSFHAAAIDAGLIKQPDVNGNGSQNRLRSIAWSIHKATRGAGLSAQPGLSHRTQPAPAMPDLAAALAEWEEAQRPPPHDREPPPTPVAAPAAERTPFADCAAIVPCTACDRPQAAAALLEVLNTYLAAVRGEPHRTGNVLPRACCRHQLRVVDVRALVG